MVEIIQSDGMNCTGLLKKKKKGGEHLQPNKYIYESL